MTVTVTWGMGFAVFFILPIAYFIYQRQKGLYRATRFDTFLMFVVCWIAAVGMLIYRLFTSYAF